MASRQGDLLDDVTRFCGDKLDEHSIYACLPRERDRLFPDEAFTGLLDHRGRCSVHPSVMRRSAPEWGADLELIETRTFSSRVVYDRLADRAPVVVVPGDRTARSICRPTSADRGSPPRSSLVRPRFSPSVRALLVANG